jgi:hypothetical protein
VDCCTYQGHIIAYLYDMRWLQVELLVIPGQYLYQGL